MRLDAAVVACRCRVLLLLLICSRATAYKEQEKKEWSSRACSSTGPAKGGVVFVCEKSILPLPLFFECNFIKGVMGNSVLVLLVLYKLNFQIFVGEPHFRRVSLVSLDPQIRLGGSLSLS